MQALELGRVELVLPYVKASGEAEIIEAFGRSATARSEGPTARRLADQWFFETVVRVHRAGEGEPFTGLKPSGLDVGPVIPVAERAVATGDARELVDLLAGALRGQVNLRSAEVQALRSHAESCGDVEAQRAYVEAMLGLEVWAHHLYQRITGPARPAA